MVIVKRLVKVGKVMSPRSVVTAVSRFGQIADGNVGAGIVFPHEQGEVALDELALHFCKIGIKACMCSVTVASE